MHRGMSSIMHTRICLHWSSSTDVNPIFLTSIVISVSVVSSACLMLRGSHHLFHCNNSWSLPLVCLCFANKKEIDKLRELTGADKTLQAGYLQYEDFTTWRSHKASSAPATKFSKTAYKVHSSLHGSCNLVLCHFKGFSL